MGKEKSFQPDLLGETQAKFEGEIYFVLNVMSNVSVIAEI